MSKTLFLTKPAVISSLGVGIEQSIERLLQQSAHGLTPQSHWIQGKELYYGAVTTELEPLPADTPEYFNSRNNQLLAQALKQIEPEIQQAVAQYGADRIAVILGTSTTGIDENIPAFEQRLAGQEWSETGLELRHLEMSSPADFVAWKYQLSGLTYGISTACTSSAKSLMSAARLLQNDLCDAVICGGVDTLSKLTINGFHALEVLSKGVTNPFSKHRDGINIGEAAALFVMSKTANSPIALLGYGSSSDAWHMSSPRPDAKGAITTIATALDSASLSAQDIAWINLHGTGTVLNDSMEATAMHHFFADRVAATSTKPLTGHTLGAAGALEAALLWGVVSRQLNPKGILPAQLWDAVADPAMPSIHLTQTGDKWPDDKKRIGLSTSFAFGGNNSALIIGEVADAMSRV